MMLPSHVLGGMVLALPLMVVAPEFATVGLAAGFLGGLFPDLDLYQGHRKALHYPVYYSVLAGGAVLSGLAAPSTVTVGAAFFLASAAVHSVSDAFGGGLELRPWEGTSEKAVYDHFHGRWVPPRRVIRYDGAVEDLLLAAILAVPLLAMGDGSLQIVVVGTLLIGFLYTILRRHLATLATVLVQLLPVTVVPYLPTRYHVDDRGR